MGAPTWTRDLIEPPGAPDEDRRADAPLEDRALTDEPLGVIDGPCERLDLSRCAIGASTPGVRVRDARLRSCELRNGTFVDLDGARLALDGCRLIGADLSGANIRDATIDDSSLRLVRALGVRLTRCWFEGCDLREAELEEGVLERVVFRDCDLRGARLLRTGLRGVDFRGSRVDDLAVSPDRLAGAIIAPEQADVFARAMGLIVLPPESASPDQR